ncbi:MAG: hypothetical protein H0V44_12745, partial [Planctomycetes bacterium]|nr:hypothetical protein [Planctomycetota bacterium]
MRTSASVSAPRRTRSSRTDRLSADPTRLPIARILAIGDELVLGRTVDTNSTHIARWLSDRGFRVDLVQTVGDGTGAIVSALGRAADGAAFVVCTGGLGP